MSKSRGSDTVVDLRRERRKRGMDAEDLHPEMMVWSYPSGRLRVWLANHVKTSADLARMESQLASAAATAAEIVKAGEGDEPLPEGKPGRDGIERTRIELAEKGTLVRAVIAVVRAARDLVHSLTDSPQAAQLRQALHRLEAARRNPT